MRDSLEIVQAVPTDFETVVSILVEAAEWHASLGITQWFPALFKEHLYPRISGDVAAGEVYLAKIDDEPIGTLTLQWSDEETWGRQPRAAGYVHRLAVRRAWAGRKIGVRMLDWAGEQCVARGVPFLRLDTMSANRKLCAYYEALGFEFRGINLGPRWQPAMYERPAAMKRASD